MRFASGLDATALLAGNGRINVVDFNRSVSSQITLCRNRISNTHLWVDKKFLNVSFLRMKS